MSWVQPLTLPNGVRTRTFGSPLRMSGESPAIRTGPPLLGQHTDEIRARYGNA
jgi:crotonobetainyl-CoA:carnitine CoA-transferase CaiB-like acyl-CoA transferase